MLYRRGTNWSYRFRFPGGFVDRSARTPKKREARAIEAAHRLAIYKGEVSPRDSWPPAPASQAPTLKDFSQRFLGYIALHKKPGTATFYATCLKRILPFSPKP